MEMNGMGSMMAWMMGLGLLGWFLVIGLLAAILVVLVQILKRSRPTEPDRPDGEPSSRPPGHGPGEAHR